MFALIVDYFRMQKKKCILKIFIDLFELKKIIIFQKRSFSVPGNEPETPKAKRKQLLTDRSKNNTKLSVSFVNKLLLLG